MEWNNLVNKNKFDSIVNKILNDDNWEIDVKYQEEIFENPSTELIYDIGFNINQLKQLFELVFDFGRLREIVDSDREEKII